MKIGNHAEKPAPVAAGTGAPAANGTTQAGSTSAIPTTADPSAKIQLSSTASTLLTGGSTPEFDAEKVSRISKSIEDGSFKVNPHTIADKLISNATELLGKVQS